MKENYLDLRDKYFLELGSGTGIVSIMLANLGLILNILDFY